MQATLSRKAIAEFDASAFSTKDEREFLFGISKMDLSHNIMVNVQGLHCLSNLTVLDISHNRIRDLHCLPLKLTRLDCSHNDLTTLEGLSPLSGLEYVCCSHNELRDLTGLPMQTTSASGGNKMKVIDASHNRLSSLHGVEGCTHMVELNIHSNLISSVDDIALSLTPLRSLRILQVHNNPMPSTDKKCDSKIRNLLPKLETIVTVEPSKALHFANVSQSHSTSPQRGVNSSGTDVSARSPPRNRRSNADGSFTVVVDSQGERLAASSARHNKQSTSTPTSSTAHHRSSNHHRQAEPIDLSAHDIDPSKHSNKHQSKRSTILNGPSSSSVSQPAARPQDPAAASNASSTLMTPNESNIAADRSSAGGATAVPLAASGVNSSADSLPRSLGAASTQRPHGGTAAGSLNTSHLSNIEDDENDGARRVAMQRALKVLEQSATSTSEQQTVTRKHHSPSKDKQQHNTSSQHQQQHQESKEAAAARHYKEQNAFLTNQVSLMKSQLDIEKGRNEELEMEVARLKEAHAAQERVQQRLVETNREMSAKLAEIAKTRIHQQEQRNAAEPIERGSRSESLSQPTVSVTETVRKPSKVRGAAPRESVLNAPMTGRAGVSQSANRSRRSATPPSDTGLVRSGNRSPQQGVSSVPLQSRQWGSVPSQRPPSPKQQDPSTSRAQHQRKPDLPKQARAPVSAATTMSKQGYDASMMLPSRYHQTQQQQPATQAAPRAASTGGGGGGARTKEMAQDFSSYLERTNELLAQISGEKRTGRNEKPKGSTALPFQREHQDPNFIRRPTSAPSRRPPSPQQGGNNKGGLNTPALQQSQQRNADRQRSLLHASALHQQNAAHHQHHNSNNTTVHSERSVHFGDTKFYSPPQNYRQ